MTKLALEKTLIEHKGGAQTHKNCKRKKIERARKKMIPLTTEKFNFYTFIKVNKQVKQFLHTLSIPSFRSGMIEREREDVTHVSRCHAAGDFRRRSHCFSLDYP